MTPTPDALKVHWKLPLRYFDQFILDDNGAEVCSFGDSNFGDDGDRNHAAAFVALANGVGKPWKDVAEELRSLKASFDTLWNASAEMIEEVSRLRAQLDKPVAVEPEFPKWFQCGTGRMVIRFDGKSSHGVWVNNGNEPSTFWTHSSVLETKNIFKLITAAQAAEILKGGGR